MQESKQRNFRNKKDNFKEKDKEKQKVERKIHRGVFIADERRKGKGGRIKSQSIPNKIQVRMKRDVGYLHESEVEWIQVGRYNKKQGRARRKQEKKQLKYKVKQSEEKAADKKSQKKYMQKQEKAEGKDEKIQKKGQEENKSEKDLQTKQEEKEEVKQSIKADKNEESNKNQRQSDSDDSSQSDRDHKNDQTQQQDEKKQEKVMQNREQDDIVIIAQIRKQISNPFWTKPFVGVIKFIQSRSNKPQKQKYMEKSTKSSVCKILDDFSLDFQPIHMRLPICYIIKDNQMQRMFEEYVQKSFKIDYSKKGGYIRNRIMDELQNTYALVKYAETCRGKVGVSIVKIIGKAKTVDGECNCFLYQHQLNDFQHEKNEEKEQNQNLELNISPVHKQYTQLVFTIDPLTSTDLDDALSVRKISQNLYEIGIHISDVSSYIDKIPRQQIARRTTSVYLPHYVFHMLPHNLVTICSENPNVKRLAFTVFVKMNEQGQILESRIEKNLIMSRFKLAYEHAEGIIRGELPYEKFKQLHKCQQDEYKTLVQKIKTLERIGLAHRKKRLVCQIFDNDQIKFQLDEDKWPISFTVTSRISSQKIVEQFMIIGNIQAAKKSVELDPKNSLIIHHPKPSDLAVRQFNEYFKILNYKIKFENSRQLQQDLLKVQNMENIPQEVKKLCFFKARRAQQTAAYKRFSEVENSTQKVHFALDLRYYTHFTSPMRRLADILVHEVLNKVVDPKVQQKQLTQKQIQQANWGRKNTKRLKKDLNQVYFCLMIQKTGKLVEAEAIAVSFGCKSISIYVPLLDMNKQIMWSDMRVDKVLKNRTDPEKIDVIIYYDKKSSSGDIVWTVDKFAKFPIKIGCTKQIPLKINFDFEVKTNKGMKKIFPKQEW